MNRPVHLIRSVSWVALVSALIAPGGWAADPPVVITPAGVQPDSGGTWHSGLTARPLDVDGNDELGSDGYDLVSLPPVRPAYLSVFEPLTGFHPGNELYAVLEDPALVGGTFVTGTWDSTPGGGGRADLFRFTLNEAAVGRPIRVGLLIDILDVTSRNGAELSLVQTVGGRAQSDPVATTAGPFNNRNPDWVFFDVAGGQTGDTFVVRGLVGESGHSTLAGVVFDSLTATGTPASLQGGSLLFPDYFVREPAAFGGGGVSSGGIFSVSGTSGHFGTPTPMLGAEGLSVMGSVWALPILIHTPGAPPLEISQSSPGFVTLRWNSQTAGFVLQSTERLSQPQWITTPTGEASPVRLPVDSTRRAYRLFKP